MPLESIARMICHARENHYAVGYFEGWSLESIQGVIDAAEQTRSPIIIGFSGEFLTRPGRLCAERLEIYAALGKAAAESAQIPCGLIFNECPQDELTLEAVGLGFNLVLPTNSRSSLDEYVRRLKRIVPIAHQRNAAVEAELGELPSGVSGHAENGGALTDPVSARDFVEQTGIDLLAVSVGNVHIRVNGEQDLDLDRLAAIQHQVKIPLVLHGGTGIAAASLREAIRLGVAKVNYGTYLKQRYLKAVRSALDHRCDNPHELLGLGGEEDVMVAGRRAVRDAVLERIEWLGCCGRG